MKIFRTYLKNERDSEFGKRYKYLKCFMNYFFDTELPEILSVHYQKENENEKLEKKVSEFYTEDEKIYILYFYYILFYIINPIFETSNKKMSYYLKIFCINYIFKKVLDFIYFSYTGLLKKIYNEYYGVFIKKKIELIKKENIKLNNFMLLINNLSENKEDKIRTFLEENYLEFKDKKNEAIGKKQSSIYLELLFYAMHNYFILEEEKYFILIKEIVDNFSKKYLYTRGDTIPYLLPPEIDKILSIYSIFLNKEEKAEEYLYYVKNIYNFLIFISDSSLYTLMYLKNKI